jgi:hypothetical protein
MTGSALSGQSTSGQLGLVMPAAARGAALSACGRYRYTLWRIWDEARPPALFVMLNPSTADADVDDPTIRRCMRFARDLGYGGLLVGNLYAYRATNPDELDVVDAPIGRGNQTALYALVARAGIVIAAWGAKPARGRYVHRERSVLLGPLSGRQVYALRLS